METVAKENQVIASTSRETTYAARMSVYFREMFPPVMRLVQACVFGISFIALLALVSGPDAVVPGIPTLVAVIDLYLLTLILRLMDELKDIDIDRRLFTERPVPSGRVRSSDIAVSLALVSATYIILNLVISVVVVPAIVGLAYTFLMFVHFFAPRQHQRSLTLSLATHNPVTAVMLILLASGFAAANNRSLLDVPLLHVIASLLMFWSLVTAWEISRKIRTPERENLYVTYSRLLGYRRSIWLLLALHSIPVAVGLWLAVQANLSVFYPAMLFVSFAVVCRNHVRLLRGRSDRTDQLRTYSELYMILICASQLLEYVMLQLREM